MLDWDCFCYYSCQMPAQDIPSQEFVNFPKRKSRLYDNFALDFIRDPRDLPFVDLILKITFLVIPYALYLLMHPHLSGWWILPYYALAGFFLGPYILMLHNTSHRPFWKNKFDSFNFYIPWVLGPFMGQTPETYFAHHIGMHHPENNMKDDLSSTLAYRRDKFSDFLKYFFRILFFSHYDLSKYFLDRKRNKLFTKISIGELGFYLMVFMLCFWNLKFALLIFVVPVLFTRFMMMNGNWAQHAFVDSKDPENSYKNSITCINSLYNRRCFNDGYHIEHHLKPSAHWTEMPKNFQENLSTYAQQDAVVFKHIDYFQIWIYLMLKKYDKLADYFVDLGNNKRSHAEIVEFLKARSQHPVLLS